jgi:hypothetical protein
MEHYFAVSFDYLATLATTANGNRWLFLFYPNNCRVRERERERERERKRKRERERDEKSIS